MAELKDSIFKNKDFLLLFTGGLISRMGNAIHLVALTWFVLELTGSGSTAGIIMLLSTLPGVLLGPFAGLLADRVSRKLLIIGMDFIRGILVIYLSWVIMIGTVGFSHLVVVTVLLSICGSFFNPAVTATLPNLVRDKNLHRANSMEHFSMNFTHVLGAAVGGLLIAALGIGAVFLINGISFILSAMSEFFIDIPPLKKAEAGKDENTFLADLKFGIKYLYQEKTIFSLFSVAVLLNFICAGTMMVGLPYLFKEVLMVNSKLYGFAQAIFPAGALIGALVTNFLPEIKKFYRTFVIMCSIQGILFIFIGIPLFPSILAAYPGINIYLILLIFLLIAGIANAVINIPISVLLQRLIPDNLRGRVFGLLSSLSQGLVPLSMALVGFLLDYSPPYYLFIGTGVSTLVLVIIMTKISSLRKLDQENQDRDNQDNTLVGGV